MRLVESCLSGISNRRKIGMVMSRLMDDRFSGNSYVAPNDRDGALSCHRGTWLQAERPLSKGLMQAPSEGLSPPAHLFKIEPLESGRSDVPGGDHPP